MAKQCYKDSNCKTNEFCYLNNFLDVGFCMSKPTGFCKFDKDCTSPQVCNLNKDKNFGSCGEKVKAD